MKKMHYVVSKDESLAMQAIPEGIPYLGDYNTVIGLLIEFSQKIMSAYDGFLRGKKTGQESEANIMEIIAAYGDMFSGRRPQEYTLPEWLDDQHLVMRSFYEIGFDLKIDPCTAWLEILAPIITGLWRNIAVHGRTEAETVPLLGQFLKESAFMYLRIKASEVSKYASPVPEIPR